MLDQPIVMRALAYSSELREGEALLRCSVYHRLKFDFMAFEALWYICQLGFALGLTLFWPFLDECKIGAKGKEVV